MITSHDSFRLIMSAIALRVRKLFRRYRIQLVLRLVLLVATSVGVWKLAESGESFQLAVALFLGIWWVSQIASIIRLAERTPRELQLFLESIRNDDLTPRISHQDRGALFKAISDGFEDVQRAFGELRTQREEQAHILDAVVRHVRVALIAFRNDGQIILINTAARRLLSIPAIRHLDHLERRDPRLREILTQLQPGVRSLVRIDRKERPLDLVVHPTRLVLDGQSHTLVSLQDIRHELEDREMDAWQQLTRVMNHEIVNSVTPIASLAESAVSKLSSMPEIPESVMGALSTIERRSAALVRFIDAYRSLAAVPRPRIERIVLQDLFHNLRTLLAATLPNHGIELITDIQPESLELDADPEMIEQVLLNLLLNSVEAFDGQTDPQITLSARTSHNGRPVISVRDNGPGVEPEALGQIFVPFFTTRPEGSGIGLPLSRQIMRMHHGTLSATSVPGEGAEFELRF